MILVDANLLFYAHDSESEHHQAAYSWWRRCLQEEPLVGIPWQTICAFLRVTTHRSALRRPLSPRDAVEVVDSWFVSDAVQLVGPGSRHWAILRVLMADAQVTGPLVTDAHLAALALEHGATVATHDRDFLRFEGLRVVFPLRGE